LYNQQNATADYQLAAYSLALSDRTFARDDKQLKIFDFLR
jgi:hypothetical protein